MSEQNIPVCTVCGYDLDWEECGECQGDGFLDWETLQFEDPLWYSPGDTEVCHNCNGKGGWRFCWLCTNRREVVTVDRGGAAGGT